MTKLKFCNDSQGVVNFVPSFEEVEIGPKARNRIKQNLLGGTKHPQLDSSYQIRKIVIMNKKFFVK